MIFNLVFLAIGSAFIGTYLNSIEVSMGLTSIGASLLYTIHKSKGK